MTDFERNVLTHYNLQNAFPTTWPEELDESEDEQPDEIGVRRSRSRYSALDRNASDRRSGMLGVQQSSDGKSNLVQKDEPDPLGGEASVVQTLRQRRLPVEQDPKLRNKFMLSSTTFSPALFLSQVHHDASTDDLVRGLQYLSQSIDQKSASLKVLVETNFERFVRAKATIDNVYTEMRNQGADSTASQQSSSPNHNRNMSRGSMPGTNFRNFGSGAATAGTNTQPQTFGKNALRKETEYGVQGIRGPLLEVTQKAEDVWSPALTGKEREASLKAIAQAVERDRELYELGSNLQQSIQQRDYEKAVQQYNTARNLANEAKKLGERAMYNDQTLSDEQVQKILVTGRMWSDVEDQVKELKRDIWGRLANAQRMPQTDEHMELISVLLELGVNDNPIWVWLLGRYDNIKTKITAVVERSTVEIEILRRRLALVAAPDTVVSASYLRKAAKGTPDTLDSQQIIEFWTAIVAYLTKLLSLSNGLLGEVVDFWDSAKSFIEGTKQRILPTGYEGESRKHHRLSEAGVRDLTSGTVELTNMIREAVSSLFNDPPVEDISSLFSPLLNSGTMPSTPLTGTSSVFSPSEGRVGRFDPQNMPGPSAKNGEPWESFAFWPPRSNSLSAVHFLGRALALVRVGAAEMVTLSPVAASNLAFENIKATVAVVRERSLNVICHAWTRDAECAKGLEDWVRSPDNKDQTRMPMYFEAFEKRVLEGIQQVLYPSEAIARVGAKEVITPPPSKLIQKIRTQFANSIFLVASGAVENAESEWKETDDEWTRVAAREAKSGSDDELGLDAIQVSQRNIRILLTLSNLKALRIEHVPQLVQYFQSAFSVTLTEESATVKNMFGQIDMKLFRAYTAPTVEQLTTLIKGGICDPDWAPRSGRPDQVRPYVYSAMMVLVSVHTEVSTTVSTAGSNGSLLNDILSYLVEKVSQALLDGFRERKANTYTLWALMQATLDTEFIAQTMSQYSSKAASDIQGQIYMELDKRSTNEARAGLQRELAEMRRVLKRLREQSRNSFGCFKKQRSDKDKDRDRQGGSGDRLPSQD
ncbi:hypothetical protein DV738_g2916, partial [Chaetothyriales sp. CBS 135597]